MRYLSLLLPALAICLLPACNNSQTTITTPHGYKFTNYTNKGGVKPKQGDWVLVQTYAHIKDSLMLDTQRDFGGPQESQIASEEQMSGVFSAMWDAIQLMGVGDSAIVYEPLDSNAMKFVPESLKDAKEVAYTMVLVSVVSAEEKEANRKKALDGMQGLVQDYYNGKLADKLKTTASGLKMMVAELGRGAEISTGEMVNVHYAGHLSSGQKFDSSFDRNEPINFITGAGQMIPGFDEGVQQLRHGSRAYLFIPPQLGYGPQGSGPIPPNAELIFYIEVL